MLQSPPSQTRPAAESPFNGPAGAFDGPASARSGRMAAPWLATGALFCGGAAVALVLTSAGLMAPFITPPRNGMPFTIFLHAVLVAGYGLALTSLIFARDKVPGFAALALVMGAAIAGTSTPGAGIPGNGPIYFGLDFFLVNAIFKGAMFLPLERWFPQQRDQLALRPEWREDMFYFLVSSLILQVLAFVTLAPARFLAGLPGMGTVHQAVGSLPFLLQLFLIMLATDFIQYWLHRTFHRVPALWRFHAVHHSARQLDWLATARLHYVENIVLRSATAIPLLASGFDAATIQVYVLLLFFYSTFQHSNIGWDLGIIERVLTTPRYHHWHHGIEKEAIDVNFAIHFPVLDRIFGTQYLPAKIWPRGYGIEGHPEPADHVGQFLYPFQHAAAETSKSTPSPTTGAAAPATAR